MGERRVPHIRGIDALRQQCKGVEKVQILRLVIQPQRSLNLAGANAQPRLEAVICNCPVQHRVIPSQLTQIAIVELRSHAQLVRDLHGNIDTKIGVGAAAGTAVHRQPIVGIRIHESLGNETVDLHFVAIERQVLRVQSHLAKAKTRQHCSQYQSTHEGSFAIRLRVLIGGKRLDLERSGALDRQEMSGGTSLNGMAQLT